MQLALVAVPWAQYDTPSAAVGVLGAFMRREAPDVRVDCVYSYVDLWKNIEDIREGLYPRIADNRLLGDLCYAAQLYPSAERTAFVKAQFVSWVAQRLAMDDGPDAAAARLFDDVNAAITAHLTELADKLASTYDVVGITTNASLFGCLALAKKIKERNPRTKTVLGGAILSYDSEPTLLREYPFVDYIVQNDGERRLLALVRALVADETPNIEGVLSLATSGEAAASTPRSTTGTSMGLDLDNLDDLPVPTYDEYEALAETHSIGWSIPMEGSRGCWWCRIYRTGNTMHTCFFCSDIVGNYREKSVERVAREIAELADRYRNVRIRFTDSILRHKDVEALATKIKEHGKTFRIFMEIRASISTHDLLQIAEAGTYLVQFGIEGLSSRYLKRIGKGTTTIQNLQAMRASFELGMKSASNLLINFPGATDEEVAETAHNIMTYAIAYEPTQMTRFRLERGSAVFWSPEHFGVSNIRPHSVIRAVLPPNVAENLQYSYLEYDCIEGAAGESAAPPADWSPVERAWQRWRDLHASLQARSAEENYETPKPLFYYDGVSFLEIVDRRNGHRMITLEGLWREIYLDAMQIRSITSIVASFEGRRSGAAGDDASRESIENILRELVRQRLMFEEDGKVLSLAVAYSREVAVERIRASHAAAAVVVADQKRAPAKRMLAIVR